jgi:Tfp pilus assembly protein PilV
MKSLLVFVVIFFSLISCTTREVSPTRDSRISIDTIYQHKVSQMQAGLDSMCMAYMDSVYRYAVDSMLKEREDEMQQLIK